MGWTEATIEVVESDKCPMYEVGDELYLSDRALSFPAGKQTCTTLVGDISETTLVCEGLEKAKREDENGYVFYCSGPVTDCTGALVLSFKFMGKMGDDPDSSRSTGVVSEAQLLADFPIFQTLHGPQIKEVVSVLKLKQYPKDGVIIEKGSPGLNLYILVSGKVEVVGDNQIPIAILGKGEVFGEMSLLSGDPVIATVRALEPSWVLYIRGSDFRKMLSRYASLQIYLARLLTKRLAETVSIRSRELASGMVGRLSEMSPAELFQTMNQTQKTGVIELDLTSEKGKVFFRNGEVIHAVYGELTGKEAFFQSLKATNGIFKYIHGIPERVRNRSVIGDFMWLLMEGLNRIDEESK